jgi:hypothetical protein
VAHLAPELSADWGLTVTRISKRLLLAAMLTLGLTAPLAGRSDDPPLVANVSFGAGLNTAQPGNAANHHILPRVIRVKQGGVVNFTVAGFHWIYVYKPGVRLEDIQDFVAAFPVPEPTFVDFQIENLVYRGINPAVPVAGPPPVSNAINRVESISFARKGTYLVICNVTGHFKDNMVAYIRVGDDRDDRKDGDR